MALIGMDHYPHNSLSQLKSQRLRPLYNYDELTGTVDPLAQSNCMGVDLYVDTVNLVRQHLQVERYTMSS